MIRKLLPLAASIALFMDGVDSSFFRCPWSSTPTETAAKIQQKNRRYQLERDVRNAENRLKSHNPEKEWGPPFQECQNAKGNLKDFNDKHPK